MLIKERTYLQQRGEIVTVMGITTKHINNAVTLNLLPSPEKVEHVNRPSQYKATYKRSNKRTSPAGSSN